MTIEPAEFLIIDDRVIIRRSIIQSIHRQNDGGVYIDITPKGDAIRISPRPDGPPLWQEVVELLNTPSLIKET